MRLIRESIIILKNWLKILLRLICEGDIFKSKVKIVRRALKSLPVVELSTK